MICVVRLAKDEKDGIKYAVEIQLNKRNELQEREGAIGKLEKAGHNCTGLFHFQFQIVRSKIQKLCPFMKN